MSQPQVQHVENLQMDGSENDDYWPLSGRPYFHMIIINAHLNPAYQMFLPIKMHPVLPRATVPVVLSYRGKNWETVYYGDRNGKRFDPGWKVFATDNDLQLGDGCVFELMESNDKNIKFKVQILRGDLPSELLERVDGVTAKVPIVLD